MLSLFFSHKKLLIFLLAGVFNFHHPLVAQRNCGTDAYRASLIKENPGLKEVFDNIDQKVAQYIAMKGSPESAITIPVVVHVVYNDSSQNIVQEQILSQINVLNKDYGRRNTDTTLTPAAFRSLATNTGIQFCLASRDPNGNWTNGVTRTFTTVTQFKDDQVKFTASGGHDAWPANDYLNIWVCKLADKLLGYASPPGAPASNDGVVIGYQYLGSIADNNGKFVLNTVYKYGRTATHEVGHWLNLNHLWGPDNGTCASDKVSDTPTQAQANFSCPAFPHVSCSNGPNGDMFMNYMDYTDDVCMNMFTKGQTSRMIASLATARQGILSSSGCMGAVNGLESLPFILSANLYPNPAGQSTVVEVRLQEQRPVKIKVRDISNRTVYETLTRATQHLKYKLPLNQFTPGIYFTEISCGTNTVVKKLVVR